MKPPSPLYCSYDLIKICAEEPFLILIISLFVTSSGWLTKKSAHIYLQGGPSNSFTRSIIQITSSASTFFLSLFWDDIYVDQTNKGDFGSTYLAPYTTNILDFIMQLDMHLGDYLIGNPRYATPNGVTNMTLPTLHHTLLNFDSWCIPNMDYQNWHPKNYKDTKRAEMADSSNDLFLRRIFWFMVRTQAYGHQTLVHFSKVFSKSILMAS